jgi:hypothetical protein
MRSAIARGMPRKGMLRAMAAAVARASASFFFAGARVPAACAPGVDDPYTGAGST